VLSLPGDRPRSWPGAARFLSVGPDKTIVGGDVDGAVEQVLGLGA
jgi:hypothetical protein